MKTPNYVILSACSQICNRGRDIFCGHVEHRYSAYFQKAAKKAAPTLCRWRQYLPLLALILFCDGSDQNDQVMDGEANGDCHHEVKDHGQDKGEDEDKGLIKGGFLQMATKWRHSLILYATINSTAPITGMGIHAA